MRIKYNDLNILITGANGFIGKQLTKKLFELGANVFVIIHKNDDLSLPIYKVVFDGTYESLSKPLSDKNIDIVIHLATYFLANHKADQINELIDSNVKFGTFLLELTKQNEIPFFISTSTYAQFYNHIGYNPQNLYAATKQSYESLQKYYEETSKTRFITLELTDTYGPGDTRPKFINLVLNSIREGGVFNMSKGEQEICYLFVDDAIDSYLKCIELLKKNIITDNSKYSVYPNEIYKLKDLVKEICSILDVKHEINIGYYPYREREIMTYIPSYPKLPHWKNKFTLKDGVNKLLTKSDL